MFVFQTNLVSEFLPIENYRGKACKEKKWALDLNPLWEILLFAIAKGLQ